MSAEVSAVIPASLPLMKESSLASPVRPVAMTGRS